MLLVMMLLMLSSSMSLLLLLLLFLVVVAVIPCYCCYGGFDDVVDIDLVNIVVTLLFAVVFGHSKVAILSSERDVLLAEGAKNCDAKTQLEKNLSQISESNQVQLSDLLDKLDGKTKAGRH